MTNPLPALLALAFLATPAAADPAPFDIPSMHEQAEAAGLAHRYGGPWEYFVGGGAASFDCDGDRRPDLFLAGGENEAALYRNRSKAGGALRFEEVALDIPERERRRVLGAYPLDVDSDGLTDLVVLRVGANLVLRGLGECRFERANRRWNVAGGRAWSTAFSAVWERDARFPTLAVGNYVDRSAPGSPFGTCEANRLLRPAVGDEPDYSDARDLVGHCTLSLLFTDWNGSGEPALRVSNDRQYHRGGQEQLWQLSPGRPAREYRTGDGWARLAIWGMGLAEADLDNDGRPEFALTSMGDTKLQRLTEEGVDAERPTYEDIAFARNATAHRPHSGGDHRPSTGWHAQFADFNNDARPDLFIAKGNVESMPDFAAHDPDNMLLMQPDGTFLEAGAASGIGLDRRGRGAVVEDFNADGMLDLLVVNREANVSLFRNRGAATPWGHRPLGNWLAVELDNGPGDGGASGGANGRANRRAVGARIVVRTGNHVQTRSVRVGGGHASGQAGFTHFGLGPAERATVRVRWPDGSWSHEYRTFGGFVVLRRGEAAARTWYPVD